MFPISDIVINRVPRFARFGGNEINELNIYIKISLEGGGACPYTPGAETLN